MKALRQQFVAEGARRAVAFSKDGPWCGAIEDLRSLETPEGAAIGSLPEAGLLFRVTENVRDAEGAILPRLIKPTDGIVSRTINRKISTLMSRSLVRFGVSPHVATMVNAVFTTAMFAVLLMGTEASLVAGGLLYQWVSIFDGVDGELARLTYRWTRQGAWADTLLDWIGNVLFFVGLSIGLWHVHGSLYAWLGLYVVAASLLVLTTLFLRVRHQSGVGSLDGYPLMLIRAAERHLGPAGHRFVRALTWVAKRDFYALVFCVLAVVGLSPLILWGLAVSITIALLTIPMILTDDVTLGVAHQSVPLRMDGTAPGDAVPPPRPLREAPGCGGAETL
jgi:CDP-L-myo-inositol myo-inositolphosphotransferase